jgi:hypothetical protein
MRVRWDGLVKNPNIIQWAERSLTVAGAAVRCPDHDLVRSRSDTAAVRRAVLVGRLASFEGLSPNAAELALLETYLQLPERCPHCAPKLKTPRVASPAN